MLMLISRFLRATIVQHQAGTGLKSGKVQTESVAKPAIVRAADGKIEIVLQFITNIDNRCMLAFCHIAIITVHFHYSHLFFLVQCYRRKELLFVLQIVVARFKNLSSVFFLKKIVSVFLIFHPYFIA